MMTLQQSLIFIMGILLTSGLYYLLLFFGFRIRLALLWLSVFCFAQTGKAFFRSDAGLAMDWLQLTEEQSRLGTGMAYTLGSFCLIAFFVYQFEVPKRGRFLAVYFLLLLLFYAFSWPQLPLVMMVGMGIALYAFRKERIGAILSLLGLLAFAGVAYLEVSAFSQVGYFVGIIIFITAISVFVGYQIREQIRAEQRARLRSSRLENQLLKKSLQPHFLFNSLMSLQEWIAIHPERAGHFVQALAEEFRSLCKMSGSRLIPIEEELAMCRTHLQIMGFRKKAAFELTTKGISGQESVPPALFHTLIENGLTHGYASKKEGTFVLEKISSETGVTYILSNDGAVSTSNGRHAVNTGMGHKYVKARLEESYPGAWEMKFGPHTKGWQVQISIDHLGDGAFVNA
ncbi:MAG: histidine kinase [Bacteroidota bacterium]